MKSIMDRISELSKIRNLKIVLLVGLVILIGMAVVLNKKADPDMETKRTYSVPQKQLADDVKQYLGKYVIIEDEESEKIANSAVAAYDTILDSDVDTITNDHIEALEASVENVLNDFLTDDQITSEDKIALSSGITQIILNTILDQLEGSSYSYNPEFEKQYMSLVNSLQAQINDLNDRTYQFKINTSIKKDEDGGVSDEDIEKIKDEVLKEVEEGEDGKDGKDGTDGRDGRDGKNGVNGKDGSNGKDGADGKDGMDGKTTYIAYADDRAASGFSLTPTETSKYIGTCISSATKQPTDPALYSNWQIYRTYIITSATDEESGTTLYIH